VTAEGADLRLPTELIALTNLIEPSEAERLAGLTALAAPRRVRLGDLMYALGAPPPA